MVKQGDIIKLSFDPQKGHEQAGFRPAVVVSNSFLNEHSIMAMLCPLTHTDRRSVYHVEIKNNPDVDGFVMCDQLKTFDLSTRKYKVTGKLTNEQLDTVLDRLSMMLEKEITSGK